GLHLLADVQDDGDVRVLGDLVGPRAGRVVDRQDRLGDLLLLGHVFELLLEAVAVAAEHSEALEFVLAGGCVKLLDQTGHRVAGLPGEAPWGRVAPVRPDQALRLAGVRARHGLGLEGPARVPDLGTGLDAVRCRRHAREERDRQRGARGETRIHLELTSECWGTCESAGHPPRYTACS